jgi:hypothetical protein
MQLGAIVTGDIPRVGAASAAVEFRYETFRKKTYVIKIVKSD